MSLGVGKFCVWLIDRSVKQTTKQTNKYEDTNKQNRFTVKQYQRARYLSSHFDRVKRMADSHATNSSKSSSKEIFHARCTPSLLSVASWIYLNSARTYCSPLNISAFHLPVVQTYVMTSHGSARAWRRSARSENWFESVPIEDPLKTNTSTLFSFSRRNWCFFNLEKGILMYA